MRHHNFMAPWTGRARNYSEAPNTGAVPQITMPFGTTVVPRACLGVIEAGPGPASPAKIIPSSIWELPGPGSGDGLGAQIYSPGASVATLPGPAPIIPR